MVKKICALEECKNEFETAKWDKKKFCSRSCSTTNNNRVSPRRVKTKVCSEDGCDELIFSGRRRCPQCIKETSKMTLDTNLGELRGDANYQIHARLRQIARAVYKKSGRPQECFTCAYSLHVEVCHVTDLKMFPDDATVADTCNVDNLVALCGNHHWEFDNGYIEIFGVLKERKTK